MSSDLPKINYTIHNITIPSLKAKFNFRPFLVKEEKLLLIAKESKSPTDILMAIKQIATNCSLDKKLNINKLCIFDLEYIFLKLRAVSVDNIIKVAYKDIEDEKTYEFEVDLNKIEVSFPKDADNNIKIAGNTGMIMKYPPATLYDDNDFLSLENDYMFQLIVRCIDKIYDGEEVYEASNFSHKQLEDFLENLDIKTFENIQKFLLNSPKIEHKIVYENSLGTKREFTLSSLNDFFSWR